MSEDKKNRGPQGVGRKQEWWEKRGGKQIKYKILNNIRHRWNYSAIQKHPVWTNYI